VDLWTNEMMNTIGWSQYAPFIAAFLVVAIIIGIAIYVYTALALYTIAKKLGHKNPWLAWIPIANVALMFQLGGFHWAWVFLLLIPVLGWIAVYVLTIISMWRIFEKRKYPGWLSLVMILEAVPFVNWVALIAYLIIIGFIAWGDKK
jgi:hypothetical protein